MSPSPKLTGDRCKCGACGLYFNSTFAFDAHRTGTFTKPSATSTRRRRAFQATVEARRDDPATDVERRSARLRAVRLRNQ
jgi:hypothetical protein